MVLPLVPIVLPLVAAATLLFTSESHRRLGSLINIAAALVGLMAAAALLWQVDHSPGPAAIAVHLTSNWAAPYGIALVADRLSALMLVVVGVVALGTALYASAGWHRLGAYFYPLFQILLMGVNGAFLTGDLFNLFVFFEVMLAASYGLQLHGSGRLRVRAGMHYIVVNLLASSLFLIGLAVLYGVLGTLSMADVADKVALVPAGDRGLLHVGVVMLAMAFLIKAAVWPLNAWLVPAYTTASIPVAALFVVMTKVGLYSIIRLWTLLFPADTAAGTPFGGDVLLLGGLATLAFGSVGVLASIRLDRIAAFSVIVSAGTLLAAFAVNSTAVTSGALFYLVTASLAACMLFMLVELARRTSSEGQAQLPEVDETPDENDNLDDDALPLVGRAFPISVAALALAYLSCALLVAGLPPLAGFVAKVAMLDALLEGMADPAQRRFAGSAWLVGLVMVSGLFATVSLTRAGIRHFWSKGGRLPLQLKATEAGAVLLLLLACTWLTVSAEPALRYVQETARDLYAPRAYIDAVLRAQHRPGPATPTPAPGEAAP